MSSRISVSEWDSRAALTALQQQSVQHVEQAAQDKPIPHKLAVRFANSPRPGTPGTPALLRKGSRIDLGSTTPTTSSRPHSPSASGSRLNNGHLVGGTALDTLEITEPIQTTQQFHDWFSRVEQSMEREQEEIYRHHLGELEDYIGSCDDILGKLEDARGFLSEMEANYKFVEENSKALQLACETMLDEQKHLVEVTDAIGMRLQYFRELETATRLLNLPGDSLVLQDDFLNMLDRLDDCLNYLKLNRDFRDAEIYIIRYQQCLTRAMTLIKMYFVGLVRRMTNEVSEKMTAQKNLSETAIHALLYTKFYNSSSDLRILLFELEKRGQAEPTEYGALLQECYTAWFTCRWNLLGVPLAEEVRRMEPVSTDLIKLARAGCNHLRQVTMREFDLFKTLFSQGETEVYRFLESLCDYLYDSLRPRILHEPKLEVLCELCTVINAMMALDAEPGGGDDDESVAGPDESLTSPDDLMSPVPSDYQFDPSSSQSAQRPALGRLRFSVLLQTILQDAQTRLVFRAQAMIQSDVLHYQPTPEDLKYPEKLEAHRARGLALWTESEKLRLSEVPGFRLPREELQVTWYPALKKTVWVLSKLNSYVNNNIFEDFAGEAVTWCRQSLSAAATRLSSTGTNTKIDGQLFLIRHLLLLKEMVRSIDLVQIERAADFSSVTDALINLLRNTSVIFSPNALFELASKGIPSFAETMTDAKTDLDSALKRACQDLIADSSSKITQPLRAFLDRCTSFLSGPATKDLPAEPWASSEAVIQLHDDFQDTLLVQAKEIVAKLTVYLDDEKTVAVLLPPLLDEIVDTYSTFYNLTRSEYGFATSSSLLTPAVVQEQLALIK